MAEEKQLKRERSAAWLFVLLIPGPAFFLFMMLWPLVQGVTIVLKGSPMILGAPRSLPWLHLLSFTFIFFMITLISQGGRRLAARFFSPEGSLNFFLGLGMILCAVYAALFFQKMGLDLGRLPFLNKRLAVIFVTGLILGLEAALSWKGWLNSGARILFGLVMFVVLLTWAYKPPESMVFDDLAVRLIFMLASLAILLAVILETIKKTELSLKFTAFGSAAVLLCAIIVNALISWNSVKPPRPDPSLWTSTYGPRAPGKPNIILIVWDTVRRDHVSVYGYERETTPYLRERAGESMVYTRAIAPSPWTLPSHASMFTGLYPRSHGAHGFRPATPLPILCSHELNQHWRTLAEILTESGYQCGGISANENVSSIKNMDQGFEFFYYDKNLMTLDFSSFPIQNLLAQLIQPLLGHAFSFHLMSPNLTGEAITEASLGWLDSIEPERPFFLFINYMDAHFPYYPPPRLANRFSEEPLGVITPEIFYGFLMNQLKERPITAQEYNQLSALYDAEILYLDEQLKYFEDQLRQRGIYDGALIILVSDHGEYLGEHSYISHSQGMYAEVLDVPLIIKHPGGAPSGENSDHFEIRKLFDLVLANAGVDLPREVNDWDAVAELYHREYQEGPDLGVPELLEPGVEERCVVFNQYKLIVKSDGVLELYNLEQDPGESNNLAPAEPSALAAGKELLSEYQRVTPVFSGSEGTQDQDLSPEQLERLRALGYVK